MSIVRFRGAYTPTVRAGRPEPIAKSDQPSDHIIITTAFAWLGASPSVSARELAKELATSVARVNRALATQPGIWLHDGQWRTKPLGGGR